MNKKFISANEWEGSNCSLLRAWAAALEIVKLPLVSTVFKLDV